MRHSTPGDYALEPGEFEHLRARVEAGCRCNGGHILERGPVAPMCAKCGHGYQLAKLHPYDRLVYELGFERVTGGVTAYAPERAPVAAPALSTASRGARRGKRRRVTVRGCVRCGGDHLFKACSALDGEEVIDTA
jgi:hypothetical protein